MNAPVENHTEGEKDMDPVAQLTGRFEQHVQTSKTNFDNLYAMANDNKTTTSNIDTKVDGIALALKPINDIAAFFRVLKWIAAIVPTFAVIIGAIMWFNHTINSITPVAGA